MNNMARLSRARVSIVAQFGADREVQINDTTRPQNSRGKEAARDCELGQEDWRVARVRESCWWMTMAMRDA